jgi:hypothetical protein
MLESLLAALYLEGGTLLERSVPDAISDSNQPMATEARLLLGIGFEHQFSNHLSMDFGFRMTDMPISGSWGNWHRGDGDDRVKQLHLTVRYKPFAR